MEIAYLFSTICNIHQLPILFSYWRKVVLSDIFNRDQIEYDLQLVCQLYIFFWNPYYQEAVESVPDPNGHAPCANGSRIGRWPPHFKGIWQTQVFVGNEEDHHWVVLAISSRSFAKEASGRRLERDLPGWHLNPCIEGVALYAHNMACVLDHSSLLVE